MNWFSNSLTSDLIFEDIIEKVHHHYFGKEQSAILKEENTRTQVTSTRILVPRGRDRFGPRIVFLVDRYVPHVWGHILYRMRDTFSVYFKDVRSKIF